MKFLILFLLAITLSSEGANVKDSQSVDDEINGIIDSMRGLPAIPLYCEAVGKLPECVFGPHEKYRECVINTVNQVNMVQKLAADRVIIGVEFKHIKGVYDSVQALGVCLAQVSSPIVATDTESGQEREPVEALSFAIGESQECLSLYYSYLKALFKCQF